ncbi:MAG: DUF3108 domain-containing protein [Thermoanaerobaculaceae bacterium]
MNKVARWALTVLFAFSWTKAAESQWLQEGEKLAYALSYFHIVAGTMALTAEPEKEVLRLTMTASSTPSFSRIFRVNNRIESLLTREPLSLLRQEASIEEGKRSYHEVLIVDQNQGVAQRRRNNEEKGKVQVPHPVLDTLGAIFAMRTFDLAPGKAFSMDVISGRAVYPLKIVVTGRQVLKLGNVKVKTLVVDPRFQDGGLYTREKKLTIFVTTDSRHLPVKIVSQLPFGSLVATLTEAVPPLQEGGKIFSSDTEVRKYGSQAR